MRILLILYLTLFTSCSRIEVIEGNERDKIKVNAKVSDNCKVRMRLSKQGFQCKWVF